MADYSNKSIEELLILEAETYDLYHSSPNPTDKKRLEIVYQHIFNAINKQIPSSSNFNYCEVLGITPTPTSQPSQVVRGNTQVNSKTPSRTSFSIPSNTSPRSLSSSRPITPSRTAFRIPSNTSSRSLSSSRSSRSLSTSPSRTRPRSLTRAHSLGGGFDDKYYEMKYYKYKAKIAKLQNK